MFAPIQTPDNQNIVCVGKLGCVSGGYDPIHPGHISNIIEAKKLCNTLVVIVNSDEFLIRKHGKPFMDQDTRCAIVSGIKGVDYVYLFNPTDPEDNSVSEALQYIKPHYFFKGGDRNESNIPEFETCKKYNIEIVNNVGIDKKWSSHIFLDEWTEWTLRNVYSN